MKVVKKLNKKKHRLDLWLDSGNWLWYFDFETQEWRVISQCNRCWISGYDKLVRGYANDPTHDTKGWPDGPFRRVLKGERTDS